MFGNKLLLNEASRLDPQLEPKYLQFHANFFKSGEFNSKSEFLIAPQIRSKSFNSGHILVNRGKFYLLSFKVFVKKNR